MSLCFFFPAKHHLFCFFFALLYLTQCFGLVFLKTKGWATEKKNTEVTCNNSDTF